LTSYVVKVREALALSIRGKLTLVIITVALLPLLMLIWVSFLGVESALKSNTLSGLKMSTQYKEGQIFLYLETLKTNARDFASDGYIRSALDRVKRDDGAVIALNSHLINNKMTIQADLLSIDVLDLQGNIVSSTLNDRIGLNQSDSIHYQKGLSKVYISSVSYNADDQLSGAVSVPITKQNQPSATIGVLVNHYRMNKLRELFSGEFLIDLGARSLGSSISKSESVYLVNAKRQGMSSSLDRVASNASDLMNTYPVEQAFDHGKEVVGVWDDHRGIPVAGVSILIEADDFKFLLLAEKHLSVAFKQVDNLKLQAMAVIGVTIISIVIISWLLSHYLTIPLKHLISSIDVVSSGKFDVDVRGIQSKDELGVLATSFNAMVQRLKLMREAIVSQNQKLLELSIRDGMTGLYNHRHLIEIGDSRVNEANRYDKPLSCMMIDVDHFKSVNDTFGHPFGDFVLTGLADVLQSQTRSMDIVGRYGGEEFAVIMPETNINEAIITAEKIRRAIEEHVFSRSGHKKMVTASIGVAEHSSQEIGILAMFSRADSALYTSKENGRNRVSAKYSSGCTVKKIVTPFSGGQLLG